MKLITAVSLQSHFRLKSGKNSISGDKKITRNKADASVLLSERDYNVRMYTQHMAT